VFDMFRGMGQMAELLRNLPRIQEQTVQFQQRVAALTAEGSAGGGMVTVKVNGKHEMLSCALSDELLATKDREMIEDLIRAATNQAQEKIRQLTADEVARMGADLGLPPGMKLPGLPGMS
jgi:nucleoid-associated protein EbfC